MQFAALYIKSFSPAQKHNETYRPGPLQRLIIFNKYNAVI